MDTQLDDRIPERLADGGDADAWEIGFDLTGSIKTGRVADRCEVLIDTGFVDRYEQEIVDGRFETYWSITTWGRLYLREEVVPGLDVPDPIVESGTLCVAS